MGGLKRSSCRLELGFMNRFYKHLKSAQNILNIVRNYNYSLKAVFHFNRNVAQHFLLCRSHQFHSIVLRKQRNTLRYDTVEVENGLKDLVLIEIRSKTNQSCANSGYFSSGSGSQNSCFKEVLTFKEISYLQVEAGESISV